MVDQFVDADKMVDNILEIGLPEEAKGYELL